MGKMKKAKLDGARSIYIDTSDSGGSELMPLNEILIVARGFSREEFYEIVNFIYSAPAGSLEIIIKKGKNANAKKE